MSLHDCQRRGKVRLELVDRQLGNTSESCELISKLEVSCATGFIGDRGNKCTEPQTSKYLVLSIVAGSIVLLVLIWILYGVHKNRQNIKAFLWSFLQQEVMLVGDGIFELIDIISDAYSLRIMYHFRTKCDYERLWVAFIVCMFPAATSSLVSMFYRIRTLHKRLQERRHASTSTTNYGKLFGRKFGKQHRSFAQIVQLYKLRKDRDHLLEQQAVSAIDRQRMYLFLLLGATEDLPFSVLNAMLVLLPRRDNLLCSEGTPSLDCQEWLEADSAEAVVLVFCISIAGLTYKLTQLQLFPAIWAEHKKMQGEAEELNKREADLVACDFQKALPSARQDAQQASGSILGAGGDLGPARPHQMTSPVTPANMHCTSCAGELNGFMQGPR